MMLKQKIKFLIATGAMLFGILSPVIVPSVASAADCGSYQTSILPCTGNNKAKDATAKSPIWGLLILVINILTAGVGVAAIGGVVYGAVLYTTAGGSQEQVKKAIGVLTNVAIGVVGYALMWSLLNFLIPGGVFTQ